MSDKRQKNQLEQLGWPCWQRVGVKLRELSVKGPNRPRRSAQTESPADTEALMEEVCERENCKQALRRVKANKGSPGVDGMTVHALPEYLKQHWPAIREQLLERNL